MRLDLVERLRGSHSVERLCRVLGVSRSGHYARHRRGEPCRVREDRRLKQEILEVHSRARGCYGTPRVEQELRRRGIRTSRKRVARLRRDLGLKAKGRRRFQGTTDSRHGDPVAPNHLGRRFEAARPDAVWVGDITYLRKASSWLYLAFLLDLYSRRIVGWSVRDRIDETLPLEALGRALETRQPTRGLLHHTDRGAPYCSAAYREALTQAGLRPSMSRRGDCLDNAVAESWVKTLKAELGREFAGLAQARRELFAYIEGFYNTRRLHSALGYRSPADAERLAEEARTPPEVAGAGLRPAAPASAPSPPPPLVDGRPSLGGESSLEVATIRPND